MSTWDLRLNLQILKKNIILPWTVRTVLVPDKRSRILEVVVVRRLLTWVLGIWSGEGMGKG
jgi:hypothetical protein